MGLCPQVPNIVAQEHQTPHILSPVRKGYALVASCICLQEKWWLSLGVLEVLKCSSYEGIIQFEQHIQINSHTRYSGTGESIRLSFKRINIISYTMWLVRESSADPIEVIQLEQEGGGVTRSEGVKCTLLFRLSFLDNNLNAYSLLACGLIWSIHIECH